MMEFTYRLSNLYWRIVTRLYYRPQFGAIGERTIIRKPLLIRRAKGIHIGKRCGIRDGARLELLDGGRLPPLLQIGDDVSIEQSVHIGCMHRVNIGDRVTIAARCTILDFSHPYDDIDDLSSLVTRVTSDPTPVEIGDGCFLGTGVVILPGVILGKRCVVGANSVVNRSMPDYTVCAGAPARILRRYSQESKAWAADSALPH